MKTVAITGISGYIGRKLWKLLDKDPEVDKIIGIDVKEPGGTSDKLKFHRMDINDPALGERFAEEGVDAGVHLAFIVDPIHDSELMRKVNIDGTRNFLAACEKAEIKLILATSSTSAYGAYPDNPVPLHEDSPLRGNEDFQYGREKREMESICNKYREEHSGINFIIVRPCIVMGPEVNNYISQTFLRRGYPLPQDYDPEYQFVHDEDVAGAMEFLLKNGKGGAYNVTGDGIMKLSEVLELAGTKPRSISFRWAYWLAGLLWKLRIAPSDPGIVNYIAYPWVASNEKIVKLGYRFKYNSKEAFLSFLSAQGRG
ncbi:MAG: SDR family oxidoreductase [Deltaproteobacteria bacterium]|nr:MAG: SDR family oxidoreductase [Deltaproteobacteria bacterium]